MKQHTRHFSVLDNVISQFDSALQTLTPKTPAATRQSPSKSLNETDLTPSEKKHAAGLMRINHTGEVCAQALYQGQALTAKLQHVRDEMEQAAKEEIDHLAWCEERVNELNQHTSVLNPVWYGISFGIGATAGLISDKVSLGFVAATEDQVCKHLEHHLQKLPNKDAKSRAIVHTMLEDEYKHGQAALNAGGLKFPQAIKWAMRQSSKIMTGISYRI